MRSVKSKIYGLIIGLLFLAGCAVFIMTFFLGQTNFVNTYLRGWWTIFLIVPGIMGIFTRGSRLGGLGLTLLGGALLVKHQGWFDGIFAGVEFWQMLVADLLLIIGLGIIGGVLGIGRRKKAAQPIRVDCGANCVNVNRGNEANSVFSDSRDCYAGREFTGKQINGVFGSYELDLRGAIIPADCTIEVNSVFGRVVILTDGNANFDVHETRAFGTVVNRTKVTVEGLPTVTVEAHALFGTVEIG